MSQQSLKKPLTIVLGAAFLAGGAANVFAATDLSQGYGVSSQLERAADGSCGEGKCGDDKKDGEGKCGEGKCGS